MNLILLNSNDQIDSLHQIRLTGRRHRHIFEVLKPKIGDELTVGSVNHRIGTGKVLQIDGRSVLLSVEFKSLPPKPLNMTLILALPRPQVIKRVLQCASSLGIKKIIFLNFYRVEKSLWQSSSLSSDAINDQLVLGLEQAKDTLMPEVVLRKSFKKFADDELPQLIQGTLPLVAHPGGGQPCPKSVKNPVTLIIGPEGGFIDYEINKLTEVGFRTVDLGERILKVEVVLPFIVGKLF